MADIKWSAFTSGGEMQVGDETVGLRSGDNYRFTFPGTGIKDVSGNYLIGWDTAGASSVNYIQFNNSITGSAPYVIPEGSDLNIDITISSKGTGDVNLTPSGIGVINASSALILSTNSPTTDLEAASKGYVDGLMPSYPIALSLGGTNASLTASNGGIFYSTATAGAILSGTATANQIVLSGSSSAPSWSTATYPATTTANQLLYSSATNVISGLTSANSGVLVTSNTGVPSILATPGVTGNMLSSNASAAPSWSTATYSNTYSANNLLYASTDNTVSGLTTANNGVLITSGAGVPSISSTLPSAVQGNITSLGTITSGTWNGSTISGQYGGTGVNNGSSTITIGGNFTMSGASAFTGTLTSTTAITFPTSGTLATTADLPSLPLSLSNGGTGASLGASNGGIVYSDATTFDVLSGTATASRVLLSGSNTAPTWSTATYPSTTTTGTILYSSDIDTISPLPTLGDGVLVTDGDGNPSISITLPGGITAPAMILSSPELGTPVSGDLSNCTNLPLATGVTGNLPVANGGTGVTAIPTTTSSGNFAAWNSYGSIAMTNIILSWATTTTGGGTTTLTGASGYWQDFTGSSNQIVKLPQIGISGFTNPGQQFLIMNNSTGTLTVNSNSNSLVCKIYPGMAATLITNTSSGIFAGDWYALFQPAKDTGTAYSVLLSDGSRNPVWSSSLTDGQIIIGSSTGVPAAANLTAGTNITITNSANGITIDATGGSGSGTVNSGTANELAYYATTGTAVSGLASANSGVLVTSGAGVPSISTTLPSGLAMSTPASIDLTNGTNLPIVAGTTGTLTVARGGTGVTSVTSTATASAWAGWDSNKIMYAARFTSAFSQSVTAGGTTTLTVSSNYWQNFTGSTAGQSVVLPAVGTLSIATTFYIINSASVSVALKSNNGTTIIAMDAGTWATCTSTSGSDNSPSGWFTVYGVKFGTASSVITGGTGLTSATAYAVLCGGTTSTGAFQSIASVGTVGQVLTSNGAGALPTMQSSGGLKSFQIFTSGTSATYTKPTGITSILVECVGGGGGGGGVDAVASSVGGGGGGGGGGYCRKWFSSASSTYTYTVGAGGAGGTAGANNGSTGGNTTFDTMQGSGGFGGQGVLALNAGGVVAIGGDGGGATNGDIVSAGGVGQMGVGGLGSSGSGAGGNSFFGGGALAVYTGTVTTSIAGSNGSNYGGGGSGAVTYTGTTDRAGGSGSAGIIIVWEFA